MAIFALIERDLSAIRKEKADVVPIPPEELHPDKPYWVPVNNITNDTSVTEFRIADPVIQTIYVDRVDRVTNVRDMTAQELLAQDQALVNKIETAQGTMDYVQFQMMFEMYNEIRVLKSLPTITVQQFKNYIRDKLHV